MTNKIRVMGNLDEATVESERFIADIDKEQAIINLEHYTFIMKRDQFYNMDTVMQIAKEFWEMD